MHAQIQKEIASRVSSSTSLTLFEQAKLKAPKEAIELLQLALEDISFRRLSLDTRVEIFLQLAKNLHACKKFYEEEKFLVQKLEDLVYARFSVQISLVLANSFVDQKRLLEAEKLMQELERVPQRKLSPFDSISMTLLHRRMDTAYADMLTEAEYAYKAKRYNEAIEAYVVLMQAHEMHRFPNTWSRQNAYEVIIPLAYRLACCYYCDKDFNSCYKMAQKYENPSFSFAKTYWKNKALYALCASKLGSYEKALAAWTEYLQKFSEHAAPYFEAIICALKCGKFFLASQYIDYVATKPLSPKLEQKRLLVTYLKAIDEGDFENAQNIAEHILLQNTEPNQEFLFLQGYHKAKMGSFEEAVVFLEKCIGLAANKPHDMHIDSEQIDARILLATCYSKLAKKSLHDPFVYLERAQTCIEEHQCPKAYIAKTRLAACRYLLQKDDLNRERLLKLMQEAPFDMKYEVSLVVYKALLNKRALELCTHSRFSKERLYPKALYLYAKVSGSSKAMQNAFLLEQNYNTFYKSHCLLLKIATWLINHAEKRVFSLLQEYETKLRKQGGLQHLVLECVYMQHYAQAIMNKDPEGLKRACTRFYSEFGKNAYHDKLLHLLALLHVQNKNFLNAKELFLEHLQLYPKSSKCDAVIMMLAHCQEKIGENPKNLYAMLYTNYPHSSFAQEAYFRLWPEQSYAEANAEAILHLKKSPFRNQKGLFAALSNFYIAQNIVQEMPDSNLSDTQRHHLQEAMTLFDQLKVQLEGAVYSNMQDTNMQDELLLRASFESAKAMLQIANSSTKTSDAFDACQSKFQNLQQTIDEKLMAKESMLLRKLWQDSSWQCFRIYQFKGEQKRAFEELKNLIEYAIKNNFFKTESVLLAMCEYALLLLRENNSEQAQALLDKAEEVVNLWHNKALMLHVWYAKSLIARYNKNVDQSMKLLSKIINDDTVSSLRVQAMFLRSELYELKGRRDLAFKQLEACSKKGGEWAERARQKIEEQYGYE